ncbi:MAG: 4Fe-4S dicluster domain-containing protein [Spirochaetota bacterium]
MKKSTRDMFKKHGWRVDRAVHNYLYFTFYYPYVKTVYHAFKLLSTYVSWFKPLSLVLKTAFSRYHAKVLSFGDTRKIFELNTDVSAITEKNRQIVPYRYAYKILFQEPDYIAVMDCPCKKTLKDEDWTINSCIAVGRGIASFWLEHGSKYNARKITQQEALAMIQKFRKHGYLTQAFFKVATGGSTGVICNCHPDTCVSLQATRFARKFNDNLSMTAHAGYAVARNDNACRHCGNCGNICPVDAVTVTETGWAYLQNECLGCELCVEHCTTGALSLTRAPQKPVPLDLDIVLEKY